MDDIKELKKKYLLQQREIKYLNSELNKIHSSRIWKLRSIFKKVKERYIFLSASFKIIDIYLWPYIVRGFSLIKKIRAKTEKRRLKKELEDLLKRHEDRKNIIILLSPINWDGPLFQRPQQVARAFAKLGYLFIYVIPNGSSEVKGFKEIEKKLILTNQQELVLGIEDQYILELYSTHIIDHTNIIQESLNKDVRIIYEYIDELSDELASPIPDYFKELHKKILKNEKIFISASADKLLDDVKKYRNKNCTLITNGVDLEHFTGDNFLEEDKMDSDYMGFIKKYKFRVGYFGALANWFDYELMEYVADQNPSLGIILLGYNYDGSLDKANLLKKKNVFMIGPLDYDTLPSYAQYFSVSTIPFLVNEITESTSPVKLFEYMAMGKPIISTDLPECRKYSSVLIGKNIQEFNTHIRHCFKKNLSEDYFEMMKKEARDNSWEHKCKQKLALINII
jgi:teichuronic acid biosynthesis glycosyltransferase TuaH